MSNLTVPTAFSELLQTAHQPTELRDTQGRIIGVFVPTNSQTWEAISPEVTATQYQQLRAAKCGISTDELLGKIGSR
jgi:hypothetical protein